MSYYYTCVMLLLLCFVLLIVSPTFEKDNLQFKLSTSEDELVRYGEEKLSTVLVTGSVNCEVSFEFDGEHHAWPIQGVPVAVNCHSHATYKRKGKSRVERGVTDEFGDFIVDLPSHFHAIPNLEKIGRVKTQDSHCYPSKMAPALRMSET